MTKTKPVLMLLGALLLLPLSSQAANPRLGAIHALVPAPDGQGALVAGSGGLFQAHPDGRLERQSEQGYRFTALAADPHSPGTLYASGQRDGQDTGLLRSRDGGRQWQRVSGNGPARFDQLAVSKTDPQRLYGLNGELFMSRDGGRSWQRQGRLPGQVNHLSVASGDADKLYAAAGNGLFVSTDAGQSWEDASLFRQPASLFAALSDGRLLSFQWGLGLLASREPSLVWKGLNNGFGGQGILRLTGSGDTLFASTTAHKLYLSQDGGKNWRAFDGRRGPDDEAERRGEKLYASYCQSCHGVDGIGETPKLGQPIRLAPALDETAHAWHHTDAQLKSTILDGPPAPSRMPAWKGTLKARDAEDLVAYIKSLWDERALRCQGPKHMDAECRL